METAAQQALAAATKWQQAGELSRAERAYREIIRTNPEQVEAWYLLGSVCSSLGRLDDAVASYREALRLRPEYAEALNNLGGALAELGRLDEAADCLRRSCRLRPIAVEIAPGELLDRLAILAIKSERIADPAKLRNVRAELAALTAVRARCVPDRPELQPFITELKVVNEAIWQVEDELRLCERRGDFGPRFIGLARSVYRHNDRRAALKRAINEHLGSPLLEEKVYQAYED